MNGCYRHKFIAAVVYAFMDEPDKMPAGDVLKFMATARDVGMNPRPALQVLVGSLGFVKIAMRRAEALLKNRGKILTETPVDTAVVSDEKVDGVNTRVGKSNVIRTTVSRWHLVDF